MKPLFVLPIVLCFICGCRPAPAPASRVIEQKMEVYSFVDEKSMDAVLSGETTLGWQVSATAYDPKGERLIVFYKHER